MPSVARKSTLVGVRGMPESTARYAWLEQPAQCTGILKLWLSLLGVQLLELQDWGLVLDAKKPTKDMLDSSLPSQEQEGFPRGDCQAKVAQGTEVPAGYSRCDPWEHYGQAKSEAGGAESTTRAACQVGHYLNAYSQSTMIWQWK